MRIPYSILVSGIPFRFIPKTLGHSLLSTSKYFAGILAQVQHVLRMMFARSALGGRIAITFRGRFRCQAVSFGIRPNQPAKRAPAPKTTHKTNCAQAISSGSSSSRSQRMPLTKTPSWQRIGAAWQSPCCPYYKSPPTMAPTSSDGGGSRPAPERLPSSPTSESMLVFCYQACQA